MTGTAETLTKGERIALLQIALAAVRPGGDVYAAWLAFCAMWRALADEIAAEPIDTEAPTCL
jgi:hypothetical protein